MLLVSPYTILGYTFCHPDLKSQFKKEFFEERDLISIFRSENRSPQVLTDIIFLKKENPTELYITLDNLTDDIIAMENAILDSKSPKNLGSIKGCNQAQNLK